MRRAKTVALASRFSKLDAEEVALLATLLEGAKRDTPADLMRVELLLELNRRPALKPAAKR
jgi:hypothetical protein